MQKLRVLIVPSTDSEARFEDNCTTFEDAIKLMDEIATNDPEDDALNGVEIKEFNTKEERDAYLLGYADAVGWGGEGLSYSEDIQETEPKIRVKVLDEGCDESHSIFMEDGGVACLHYNQEHMLTTYYQSRIKNFNFETIQDDKVDWDELSEGKCYLKDWEDRYECDDEMILDAIQWLHVGIDLENVIIEKIKL